MSDRYLLQSAGQEVYKEGPPPPSRAGSHAEGLSRHSRALGCCYLSNITLTTAPSLLPMLHVCKHIMSEDDWYKNIIIRLQQVNFRRAIHHKLAPNPMNFDVINYLLNYNILKTGPKIPTLRFRKLSYKFYCLYLCFFSVTNGNRPFKQDVWNIKIKYIFDQKEIFHTIRMALVCWALPPSPQPFKHNQLLDMFFLRIKWRIYG